MISPSLLKSVKTHEGRDMRAYKDSVGVWTIGYGTNLQELEIDEELATRWLHDRLKAAAREAGGFPWFKDLEIPRQDVVVEMIYNLGLVRFAKFGKMHAAILAQDYGLAATEMRNSTWAGQVGHRAERLAAQMRTGEYWN